MGEKLKIEMEHKVGLKPQYDIKKKIEPIPKVEIKK